MQKTEIPCYKQFLLFSQCFSQCFPQLYIFSASKCGIGLMPLLELRSYHGEWSCTCVSWLSHTSTNTTFFPKPPTTFLTCFSRGEGRNKLERKFASTPYRTRNHKVMSLTRSPLSHPGWISKEFERNTKTSKTNNTWGKKIKFIKKKEIYNIKIFKVYLHTRKSNTYSLLPLNYEFQ